MMITDPQIAQVQRKIAVDLFNYVWQLLNKPDRTIIDNDTMVHAAHASRYHWGEVGNAVNLARGEWQISRVYSVLERAEPALYHAQRCLDHCVQNSIGDFDLAFAYEALARAWHVAGQSDQVAYYLDLGRTAGGQIAEEDDRELFFADLEAIEAIMR
jgi:hypothetical protein